MQITFTVKRYQALIAKQMSARWKKPPGSSDPDFDAYWDGLPEYLLARCPICGHELRHRLDTHSLGPLWHAYYSLANSAFGPKVIQADQICPHFVAMFDFIDLQDQLPTIKWFHADLDVPFVMPAFLADQNVVGPEQTPAAGFAVLHSLPICRIEAEQFVPRHAAYFMTYYATDPQEVWRRRWADPFAGSRPVIPWSRQIITRLLVALLKPFMQAGDEPDWKSDGLPSIFARDYPELYDLPLWVERGRLLWLDLTSADLPLRGGPVAAFPYGGIPGHRRSYYTDRNGKLRLGL